jgi:type IV secretory pathway TraG/TraD family ATPase VirD4
MKFKVSKNDLIIFIIFCILLLYLCAIGVMNFVTFGAEGHLWGLNPFPAFAPNYLPITLLLFFAALVMIFTSVSSYIFSREKGPGIGIKIGEKEEKGYSRWSTDKEVKTDKDIEPIVTNQAELNAAGVPLIIKKNQIWVDNGEYHTLVIGASGSGKTRCVVKPLVNILAKHGESMILTDPKAEIYQDSAEHLRDLGYNVIVLNFRDPDNGSAWNPLMLPYQYYKNGNKDKATELLDDVALNILYDPNNKGEPFWEKSAADFFSGLALGLFEDAKEEEININSISVMSTDGDERIGSTHYINEYFNLKGTTSSAYTFAANTINAPSDTQGGILSTFRQKIRLFASREKLSEMLSHSDFNMLDIGKGKTAVFIIIHDEKTTYHALATIFIKQCYETLIDVAQQNGGKLPYRTNFILDEFANMPPLKDVDSMVTAARSRKMRFTFIIQNFAQLNDVYGKEVAEVIRGNCGNTIYLISHELAALEEISKMCGEVKSKDKDKTASTPLITVTDLQKLKFPDALLMRMRLNPYKTKLPLNDKVDWGYTLKEAKFTTRETTPVQIFDIKTFVKDKKREKMMEAINGDGNMPNQSMPMDMFGGMNQFNMGMPSMPNIPSNQNVVNRPINPMMNNDMGDLNNVDLDAMIKDIDKKIAELEAQEKEEAANNDGNSAESSLNDQINNNIDSTQEAKVIEPEIDVNPDIPDEEDIQAPSEQVVNREPVKEKIEPKKNNIKTNEFFDKDFVLPNPSNINEIYKLPKEEVKPSVKTAPSEIDDIPKPKINVDTDSVVVNDNVISDDEFFDDFFGDDDSK